MFMRDGHTYAITCLAIIAHVLFLICPLWSSVADGGSAGDNKARAPAVLFIGGVWDGTAHIKENMSRLDKEGYHVAWMSFSQICDNAGLIDKFDCVVVLSGMSVSRSDDKLPQKTAIVFDRIHKLLSDGGGLMVFTQAGRAWEVKGFNMLTGSYGLKTLYGCVLDSNPSRAVFGWADFAYSDAVSSNALTSGVSGVWCPVAGKSSGMSVNVDINRNPHTVPFETDGTWTTLLSAAPSTIFRSFGSGDGGDSSDSNLPSEMKKGPVPIVAVKADAGGAGRMAVCAVNSVYSNFVAGNTSYEGVCTGAGVNGKKSDLDKLLMNVLDWLCEKSIAAKRQTITASMTNTFKRRPFKYPPPLPPGRAASLPAKPEQFKGVIGVRTAYSGGKSTVKEYAETASMLGISFLAFLEDYENISNENLEKLKEDCGKHSNSKLALIPGLRIQSSLGINFFGFKENIKAPIESFLDKTRKLRHYSFNGSQQSIDGTYEWVALNGYRSDFACGNFRLDIKEPSGIPPWNYNFHNPLISVYTYKNGELADSMLDTYLKCAARTEWVSPVCVDLIDSAAELAASWKSDRPKTVWLRNAGQGLEGMKRHIGERDQWKNPATYITNGPVIEEWLSSGPDCDGNFFDWTRLLWRLRFTVSSDNGIKEVKVMDGTKLFHRYNGCGAKRISRDILFAHNDMRNMILIVTDNKGRTAVSDENWDKNALLQLTWCIDRNNLLASSILPAPKSFSGSTLGNYPVPINLEKGAFRENLAVSLNNDKIHLPGFDGYPEHILRISPAVTLKSDQGSEGGPFFTARDFARGMSSPDCAIHEISCSRGYDKKLTHPRPWTKGPLEPLEFFNAEMTYVTFTHPGHMPAPVLIEGSVTILKDITFSGRQNAGTGLRLLSIRASQMGGYEKIALHRSGDDTVVYDIQTAKSFSCENFGKYSYIYFFPSVFGSSGVISLSDNLSCHYQNDSAFIGLNTKEQKLSAGTKIHYKALVLTSGFDEPPSLPDRLETALGMNLNKSVSYKIDLDAGKVISQEYILRADGNGSGIAGSVTLPSDFPAVLPLIIENLNRNWTSVLYERDKKRFRPLGMRADAAFCHISPLEKSEKIFVGHPFTADDKNLLISVTQTGPDKLTLQLHNPGLSEIKTKITRSSYFDFVTVGSFDARIPSGETVTYNLISGQAEYIKCHD